MSTQRVPAEPPDPERGSVPYRIDSRWTRPLLRFRRSYLQILGLILVLSMTSVLALHLVAGNSSDLRTLLGAMGVPPSPSPSPSTLPPPAARPSAAKATHFVDKTPILSAHRFWSQAEAEIAARGLDTCGDQLGRSLVSAYVASALTYCSGPSNITCMPVHHNTSSKWWPYPASTCISTNLRPWHEYSQRYYYAECKITPEGTRLKEEMGTEFFVGRELRDDIKVCKQEEEVRHPVLVVRRQDRWNPFHVAEDLVTTLESMFIASAVRPDLKERQLQLAFTDNFVSSDRYSIIWERMGAYPARNLQSDPWPEGTCFTDAIHSPMAGASLLSATGVKQAFRCASSITWASSYYYRNLFGLDDQASSMGINVLWLSRAQFSKEAKLKGEWSDWRESRLLDNEDELVSTIEDGLRNLCQVKGWEYETASDLGAWERPRNSKTVVFASIDPTTLQLQEQIRYLGHTSVLTGVHGGALGLSLFLPPGRAAILELHVTTTINNWHFQHMAAQMGHEYEMMVVSRTVPIEEVYKSIEGWVLHQEVRL